MRYGRRLAVLFLAILEIACAQPAGAANITDGLNLDQIRTLTIAMERARKASRSCFEDVDLPHGMVMLDLTLDGAAGTLSVASDSTVPLSASVESCVKAAYAAQAGPTFDGPPRVTTVIYRPRDRY